MLLLISLLLYYCCTLSLSLTPPPNPIERRQWPSAATPSIVPAYKWKGTFTIRPTFETPTSTWRLEWLFTFERWSTGGTSWKMYTDCSFTTADTYAHARTHTHARTRTRAHTRTTLIGVLCSCGVSIVFPVCVVRIKQATYIRTSSLARLENILLKRICFILNKWRIGYIRMYIAFI